MVWLGHFFTWFVVIPKELVCYKCQAAAWRNALSCSHAMMYIAHAFSTWQLFRLMQQVCCHAAHVTACKLLRANNRAAAGIWDVRVHNQFWYITHWSRTSCRQKTTFRCRSRRAGSELVHFQTDYHTCTYRTWFWAFVSSTIIFNDDCILLQLFNSSVYMWQCGFVSRTCSYCDA